MRTAGGTLSPRGVKASETLPYQQCQDDGNDEEVIRFPRTWGGDAERNDNLRSSPAREEARCRRTAMRIAPSSWGSEES